jgi:hypothetical protein
VVRIHRLEEAHLCAEGKCGLRAAIQKGLLEEFSQVSATRLGLTLCSGPEFLELVVDRFKAHA